ncbi:MAG: lamin tail domain-containing protein [Caldilineaceae bacterium]|nr:lamin tail domain-containing protein [Caldilineaceae bacterium]
MYATIAAWLLLIGLLFSCPRLHAAKIYPRQSPPVVQGEEPENADILITEIMYNPPDLSTPSGATVEGGDLEFIELHNRGTHAVNLAGISFSQGIEYAFPATASPLEPDARLVLASSEAGFVAKYGFAPYAEYSGQLDNGGETLRLTDETGADLLVQPYGDDSSWPCGPDGGDFSLVPAMADAPGSAASWRRSAQAGGSPGLPDPPAPPDPLPVIINEVLAHTDLPAEDSVEFYNPTEYDAYMGGWWLSDTTDNTQRYQLPEGFYVPAGGYAVITESHFGAGAAGFGFSENGEEVVLTAATCAGAPTGYRQVQPFGASPNGVSLGRYVNNVGAIHFPLLESVTLGGENAPPLISDVIISRIMYHPPDGAHEFIQVTNRSAQPAPLFLEGSPWLVWQIAGVGDFTLPPNLTLGPDESMLLVPIAPDQFRERYAIPPEVPIIGPYPGNLNNDGETIALLAPGPPNAVGPQPYFEMDVVTYSDTAPWPSEADGEGAALARIALDQYGNDPDNWRALGKADAFILLPIVRQGERTSLRPARKPHTP